MRYLYLIAFAMLMAMPTVSTLADEPTADEGPAISGMSGYRHPSPLPTGIFRESGPVCFRLVGGRFDVDPMRYRKGTEEHRCDQFEEDVTVSASSGVPSVYYNFKDGYQRIRLTAEHGGVLRMKSTILATGERAELVQDPGGLIQFSTWRPSHADQELDESTKGPTLLHIIGRDEDGFDIHFETIVTRMLRGRSLIELTERTEDYLCDNANRLTIVSHDRVHKLIEQLGASKNSIRRAAVRELKSYGSSVIPLLATARRRSNLDTEQIVRIEKMLTRRGRTDDDTPRSLAQLLAADREHWQILAKRMNSMQWLAANDHIRRCGLKSLTR